MPELATDDPLLRLTDLLRTQRAALAAIARAEGLSAEDALECVQDALCTFLARQADGVARESAWTIPSFKTMVRNAARNFRRLHAHAKPHVSIDAHVQPGSPLQGAEALLAHAEDLVRLRVCVAELCTLQRSVVTLRLLEERSGEDVAALLGVSRGHVDVLVHRAKAALRSCMRAPA